MRAYLESAILLTFSKVIIKRLILKKHKMPRCRAIHVFVTYGKRFYLFLQRINAKNS